MSRRRRGGRAIGPRLSRVTKAAGGPDGRDRPDAPGWVLDLINARVPDPREGRVGARLHVLALELPQLSK